MRLALKPRAEASLGFRLGVTIVVKIIFLTALSVYVIRPQIKHVDTDDVTARLTQPLSSDTR